MITDKKITYDVTTFENNVKNVEHGCKNFEKDPGDERGIINIRPEIKYQEFEGFGGAFTDSSGYVYSMMGKEDKEKVHRLHNFITLFAVCRLHYFLCRITINIAVQYLHSYRKT